jgi:hypothetical protein
MIARAAAALVLVALLLVAALAVTAVAQERGRQSPVRIYTGDNDVSDALRAGSLAIDDPLAVLSFVLSGLPVRTQVYPTENYFYFRFIHHGVPYTGNIRLSVADRDEGKLHFAYGVQPTDWNSEPEIKYTVFDASKNVTVRKLAPFEYRVAIGDKAVIFVLNDLSQVKPLAGLLRADETFIGPVFDESAVRFFLVFNAKAKVFHYLLDESTVVPDQLAPLKSNERILIGRRTGFAFYREGDRKLLIGVNERNSRLNTYLDGPFDQLPENFIEGEALREAIVAASPEVKGRIDRLGYFSDGSGRFLINPYRLYRTEADLALFQSCLMNKRVREADRPRCFVISDDQAQRRNPVPLALERR